MIELCYQLTFLGALHVDSRGTGFYEKTDYFVRSDTLSAAIASTWLQLYPDDAETLFQNTPYLLSSAFPFYKDMLFFPRACNSQLDCLEPTKAKKFKRAIWLEQTLWQKSINTKKDWHQDAEDPEGCFLFPKGQGMHEALWHVEEKPRIAIDRASNHAADGLLFNFARVHYHSDGGLFFLARFEGEKARKKFEGALSLLGDCGLGSDRNSGHGHFVFTRKPMPLLKVQKNVCLSLCNPSKQDMQEGWLKHAAYDLVKRGGWIGGSSSRKKTIRMFGEGSTFQKPLKGQVLAVGKHPSAKYTVYRDGRAFMVGGQS